MAAPPDALLVGERILERHREEHGDAPMDAESLHCMAYFAQCWSLAWTGGPAFDGAIIAAPEGPRSPRLVELVADRPLLVAGDLAEQAAAIDRA